MPALFSWGDFNGDGRLDLAAVGTDGKLQVLVNSGDGRFENVTERVGLFDVTNAALALWADYDGDGRLDLFVGAREGASRLFHQEAGQVFIDVSAMSGLASAGAVQSAQWFDYDGDGRLDLFIVTAQKSELYRGLEGGLFELTDLPLTGSTRMQSPQGVPVDSHLVPAVEGATSKLPDPGSQHGAPPSSGSIPARPRVSASAGVVVTSATPAGPHAPTPPSSCVMSITDQALPANCLNASTTPTLGMLYPISANLFVATGGNVGIGTTSPAAKLEVAGTARITNTLTLNPSGDLALDVSTGSIYKGGALFIHTNGGPGNSAVGTLALSSVTTGFSNTASGKGALQNNTTGFNNTALGLGALSSNTTGYDNTASGHSALFHNTSGIFNTAIGYRALYSNATGRFNTAVGTDALAVNTTGNYNTANGDRALLSNTTGSRNTAEGFQALFSNTASNNTASGYRALFHNTSGNDNAASGYAALMNNSTGSFNTASGQNALLRNTTGRYNTAIGYRALQYNTTGSHNTAIGFAAGYGWTSGNDNIAIGNNGAAGESGTIRIGAYGAHTRTFIAGIRAVTTGNANAIPVLIDSAGQLGTVSSSRRFKKDIADMGELTDRLLELRPVVFHYKQEQKLPNGSEVPLEYGLIAEEVAEIFPDLVVYDEGGKPFTVKYHILSSMLLNEMKKQSRELGELHGQLVAQNEAHARELKDLRNRLDAIESRASPATLPTAIPAGSH